MTYWGRDGDYLKYRCPQQATHRFCCLQEHKGTDRCSLSPYGHVIKLDMKDDPRRYVPVPRETMQFERLYKTRTACERLNSRLKENLLLDDLKVRGLPKVKVRIGLNLLVMLAIASAQAFIIEPRAAKLKKEIGSFETTAADNPLRKQFRKLHGISAAGNLAVIAGGVLLIVLLPHGSRRKEGTFLS